MSKPKLIDTADPLNLEKMEIHPLRSRAKVLLSSIFGPYAQDDTFGSRRVNPMELYHNQVIRLQGPFSIRMFHRSCGLLFLHSNIDAPSVVLDYPTLNRFKKELLAERYDIIGISAIPANVKKVQKMCSLVREAQPQSIIVVGGHITNMKTLPDLIDADFVVRGEGIRWFRKFLGQEMHLPIRHPLILSSIGTRCMGMNLRATGRNTAAVLVPSVGCPIGCNFCATSAMFGGTGKFVFFYETGDELFDIMCQMERRMGVHSFMVLDENFLLHRLRALRLLELIEEYGKTWPLYVFSSANTLLNYSTEQLVRLGISWVWLGLEGKNSNYKKLTDIDSQSLVRELRANGIRVLASTIIGLEEHTSENIDELIEWAVDHDADFHQFMLYTAVHGSPLRNDMEQRNQLLAEHEIEEADAHGQYRFNYSHPHIKDGLEEHLLFRAFQRDFDFHGPSVIRMMETVLNGWLMHKNHPKMHVRRRIAREIQHKPILFAAALWATTRWFKGKERVRTKVSGLLNQFSREFGFRSRLAARALGPLVMLSLHREQRRLRAGVSYEPPTVFQTEKEFVVPQAKGSRTTIAQS